MGQIAVIKITNKAAGSFWRKAAKAIGTHAKGGTVRNNWKIGSKALDIILFVPINIPKPIVGIGLGILIGTNKMMSKALDPIFQLLRTVPPLAWVPIALAALRQNEPAALFVIFITAIWPILINTAVGVKQIPTDYNNVAKVLQLSKQEYFFNILIPSALPYIFTGLRIALGLAWLAIIAAEIVDRK